MSKEICPLYADYIGTKPTFAKILRDYFFDNPNGEPISMYWNDETKIKYINDYNNRLLPALKWIPVEDMTNEDVLNALEIIKREWNYDQATLQHYRYIFGRVYYAGVDNGIYNDLLNWRFIFEGKNYRSGALSKKRVHKKVLSVEEELKLWAYFKQMKIEEMKGEDIGLLLMALTTIRNHEVTALDFGDYKCISNSNNVKGVEIYKSTMKNSAKRQPSGKTGNAPRKIPLIDYACKMIECRREFLKKQNVEDIDKCPIACRGYELSMPCTAANITNHARVIFEQLGIGKYALLEAARDLYETQEIGIIEEANPTAYLLRRNSANRLYQLGFTWAEMEFLMGHRIDDDYVNKKYLMEDEAITKISQKLLHHPANLFFGYENEDNLVVKDELESSISNNQSIYFNSMGEKGRYICYVVTNELDDIPKIECSNGINIVESTNDYYPLQQRRDVIVDISVINKKLYKEKIKEWRQKNE